MGRESKEITQKGNKMQIRKATLDDIPELISLGKQQLIDEGSTANEDIDTGLYKFFLSKILDNSMVELVAEVDGEMIATAALIVYDFPPSFSNKNGKKGYIASVYTKPEYRRQGIATTLVNQVVAIGKERGIKKFFLHASDLGKPVYLKCGFKDTGDWLTYEITNH